MSTTCPPNGRFQSCANQTEGVHADVTCADFVRNSHQLYTALFTTGRAPLFLGSTHEQRQFLKVVGRIRGWQDTSSPEPALDEPASDELVMNAVHRLQDRLQQTLYLTQRRSQKQSLNVRRRFPKATLHMQPWRPSSWNAWQDEAKRVHDQKIVEAAEAEETYYDAIRRTLEKNEALEKQVKTVTHESGLFGGHRSFLLPGTH